MLVVRTRKSGVSLTRGHVQAKEPTLCVSISGLLPALYACHHLSLRLPVAGRRRPINMRPGSLPAFLSSAPLCKSRGETRGGCVRESLCCGVVMC